MYVGRGREGDEGASEENSGGAFQLDLQELQRRTLLGQI